MHIGSVLLTYVLIFNRSNGTLQSDLEFCIDLNLTCMKKTIGQMISELEQDAEIIRRADAEFIRMEYIYFYLSPEERIPFMKNWLKDRGIFTDVELLW